MEYVGKDIVQQVREMPIEQIDSASPRELGMLAEQASATVEAPKFFDFEKAEELGLPKDAVAKQIETKALSGEVKVPFNFNKFHSKFGDNYQAMYEYLKVTPEIKKRKEASKMATYMKQAIRDRAKEALNAGEIDRATYNQIYRKAHTAFVKHSHITDAEWASAIEETFAGAMQDSLGIIKTGVDMANKLGADIEDTGLQASITHYKNAMLELRKASGDAGNSFLTYQNLGSFILSLGALGKAGMLSKPEAHLGNKLVDIVVNSAIAGGLGYASSIGRGEDTDEAIANGVLTGAIGGVGGTVLLHSIGEIFTPNFKKLEDSLAYTLKLSDDEIEEASKNYAKYMDIDPNTPEARVKGILTTYGTNLAGVIKDSATSSNRLVVDLQKFINVRKEHIFDELDKVDLDNLQFNKLISEANLLAQSEWGRAMNHIKNSWNDAVDIKVDFDKDAFTPSDYFSEAMKSDIKRVQDSLENPTIEKLMGADKALNEMLRTNFKSAPKAHKLEEIQKNIQNTIETGLKSIGRDDLASLYKETKEMYKLVATAKNSKVTKILAKNMKPEAKLKILKSLSTEFQDMEAIAKVVGEKEASKLEKVLLKAALKSNKTDTLRMSWNVIMNSAGKKALVTKEGKALQQFIADMDRHFKLDDMVVTSLRGKSDIDDLGISPTLMGKIKASYLGRFAKYIMRHIRGFTNKDAFHDYNLETFLSDVYSSPDNIKKFNEAIENMNPSLLEKLKNDSWYGGDDFKGEASAGGNKPRNPNDDGTPPAMQRIDNGKSIGHDIKIDENGKTQTIYDKPKFEPINPKIDTNLRKSINLDNAISNLSKLITKYKYNPIQTKEFIDKYVSNLSSKELKPLLDTGLELNEAKSLVAKEIEKGILVNKGKNSLIKPIKLRPDIEDTLLRNPERELELYAKEGVYLDLYGTPKQVNTIDKALKELQDKGLRFIKSDKIEVKDIEGIPTIYGDNQLLRELTPKITKGMDTKELELLVKEYKPLTKPKEPIIGEVEEYLVAKGADNHPTLEAINTYGDKLVDYVSTSNGGTKKIELFKTPLPEMLPVLQKVASKSIEVADLKDIRRFTALRLLNPTYITNPYVAQDYGLQVDWSKIPQNKMEKYKESYREAKFFKVLAGSVALASIVNASPITVDSHIKQYEDIRLKPYKDSRGYWTIGYGHKLNSKELAKYKQGISKQQAEELFKADLGWTKSRLKANIKNWNTLDSRAKLVLTDMTFNMGMTKLLKFKKFLGYINQKDYKKAGDELLDSIYAEQVGARALKNSRILKEI